MEGNGVTSPKGFGMVLLSIILACYYLALAEQAYDNVNATELLNSTNETKNISQSIDATIFEAHPPKRIAFTINGSLTRIINASGMDQSSLNAAILKHGVEETPHGHVTYYN